MTQKIKLMPDYCCYPLWGLDLDNIGNIDPGKFVVETIPLVSLQSIPLTITTNN